MKTPSLKSFSAAGPWEPVLLFWLFFLPGYLSPFLGGLEDALFNSPSLLWLYLITIFPQIWLVFYLIDREQAIPRRVFGLGRLTKRDLALILPSLAGVFLFLILPEILLTLFPLSEVDVFWETLSWSYVNPAAWPLVLLVCLAIGYHEEIYFRAYLFTRLELSGWPRSGIIFLISLLFASGHLYQGLPGFVVTFALGVFFGGLFLRYRSLHLAAITHGLYNFTVLLLSYFQGLSV
ncbi:MAG: CPBP family intramembrane metalloprotease [Spirochaetales bacterium]|jgi:membrane protease YdiL (CAAX protease family)|nr:CPBP family intramembrane metalloprotease [Spirochaetales bacterium]